jgi:hypothetical protein
MIDVDERKAMEENLHQIDEFEREKAERKIKKEKDRIAVKEVTIYYNYMLQPSPSPE